MNNKWIVPIVAILLCAVSLIGAGYAAYTASLSSEESADVANNYTVLTYGTHTINSDAYVEYNSVGVATISAAGAVTSTTTTFYGLPTEVKLLSFKFEADTTGDNVETLGQATVAATLDSNATINKYFNGASIKVVPKDSAEGTAGITNVSKDIDYDVVLVLTNPDDANNNDPLVLTKGSTDEPGAKITVTFDLKITQPVS